MQLSKAKGLEALRALYLAGFDDADADTLIKQLESFASNPKVISGSAKARLAVSLEECKPSAEEPRDFNDSGLKRPGNLDQFDETFRIDRSKQPTFQQESPVVVLPPYLVTGGSCHAEPGGKDHTPDHPLRPMTIEE